MDLRFVTWIWQVTGSLPLGRAQTREHTFDQLEPLFHQTGTRFERTGDTLTFRKQDAAAQDKMSIFDHGVLKIEEGVTGPLLRYRLTSRALLWCFLAPMLFVGVAQLTIAINAFGPPTASKTAKPTVKDPDVPLNWIDKALGAPAPEKPGKDPTSKQGGNGKQPSPTPAYVFAGIFAVLYVVGRILEDRLIRQVFKKSIAGASG